MENESHPLSDVQCRPPATLIMPGAVSAPQSAVVAEVRARTPARILTGHAGPAYRTATWLELRRDHAAARDAINTELDLTRDLGTKFIHEWGLFEVNTLACTKQEFLLRPDLGRLFSDSAKAELELRCPRGCDIQLAIADGLSATAVRVQIPAILPLIATEVHARGWRFGQPFFIRYGRVGTLNEIGELLEPTVAILLIGERPGLAIADSLSAYMAYRPRIGHDDARRNLISNIHSRGVSHEKAAYQIGRLAAAMIQRQTSGVALKKD